VGRTGQGMARLHLGGWHGGEIMGGPLVYVISSGALEAGGIPLQLLIQGFLLFREQNSIDNLSKMSLRNLSTVE